MLQIKRAYEAPSHSDGLRILVDRLWPRGLSKSKASVDTWLKDIAPSSQLRTWFDHDPDRFKEFKQRYTNELRNNPVTVNLLKIIESNPRVTLLYGARDPQINHALVLHSYLQTLLKK